VSSATLPVALHCSHMYQYYTIFLLFSLSLSKILSSSSSLRAFLWVFFSCGSFGIPTGETPPLLLLLNRRHIPTGETPPSPRTARLALPALERTERERERQKFHPSKKNSSRRRKQKEMEISHPI
jgi:O-antigen ligase